MRIALVQCPAFGIDKPPLALGYLSAFLRGRGYEVNVFDLNVDLYSKTEEKDKKFWEFQYVFQWLDNDYFSKEGVLPKVYFRCWAEQILSSNPDVIGFSVQSSSLEVSIKLAKEIKNIAPDKTIIFGGPLHLSYSIEHTYYLLQLENASKTKVVDIVVLGEGEETLVDILKRTENKSSLEGCAGTVTRENGRLINNGLRPLMKDLDLVPFPEFGNFPASYKFKKRLPVLGSRGCIHRCTFCDDTLIWQYYRSRSAGNILEEMKLRKKEGVEFLEFNDLLINGNLKQLSELCDLLIKERVKMPWGGSATIDSRMDFNFLKKLKRAGCCYLNYGIESASSKLLREMNKSFTIEVAKKVLELTHKAGISVCTNWIVGFPTETRDDFKETLNFVRNNIDYLRNNIMVNSFILKGNCLLFENKKKFGIVSDKERNWYSLNGVNTVEERKRRYDEFIELISEFNDKPAHETFQG
ncbi:MAG: B12-binding domain-containing radical SAM protein [Candidatus Omnitrophica bacterium]|nr:B12-binding domain-containing radical SAM protein [Candidatus Omnitrophota bacterium]